MTTAGAPVSGRRCVVLGAQGYLGRHLVDGLRAAECDVIAVGHQGTKRSEPAVDVLADVSDVEDLRRIDWRADAVFPFAALAGTHAGFRDYARFLQVNEQGLLNVLTAIRESGATPRVVFPSTRLVYAGSSLELEEESPKEPRSIYGVNKLACEFLLQAYRRAFDIPFTVFRIGIPYAGSHGSSYGLMGAFIRQAREKGQISVYGDGALRRTATHVDDLVDLLIRGAFDASCANEVVNVPGESLSLQQIATGIATRFGVPVVNLPWPNMDLRIESGDTVFSGRKAERLLLARQGHQFGDWAASLSAAV
jgi:UDP-glucose 4-epimerase